MAGKRGVWHSLFYRIEEIILAIIILLNVFDFLEMLSPSVDYIKKIISWTALGYLLYKASLTKVFFGSSNKKLDLVLIVSYFLLILNKVLFYANLALHELRERVFELLTVSYLDALPEGFSGEVLSLAASRLEGLEYIFTKDVLVHIFDTLTFSNSIAYVQVTEPVGEQFFAVSTVGFSLSNLSAFIDGSLLYFIKLLVDNQIFIEKIGFYVGCFALIVLSLYLAFQYKIKSPSLMHVLHSDKKVRDVWHRILRFFIILIVLSAFFIFVFNLTMEWLTIAIDAPLIVIALFLYLFLLVKHHKRFDVDSFIYRIGNFGEEFYERFVSLFHTKNGLRLGICGMLVLHLLTDIGIFIIPYTVFVHDPLYFAQDVLYFGVNHVPLFNIPDLFSVDKIGLLFQDLALMPSFVLDFNTVFVYALNALAIVLLFGMPAFIWYHVFKRKSEDPHQPLFILFFVSLLVFLLFPLFDVGPMGSELLVGVDIQTNQLSPNVLGSGLYSWLFLLVVPLVGLLGFVLHYLYKKLFWRKWLCYLSLFISIVFFFVYLLYFFMDSLVYYWNFMGNLFNAEMWFLLGYSVFFFVLTLFFYVGGFIFYIYEIVKYFHVKKWKK